MTTTRDSKPARRRRGRRATREGRGPAACARPAASHKAERGYTLVALLALMTILALVATSAAPSLRQQSQRELEKEAIARGEEVAEAIYRWTQAKGAPPSSLDDLVKGLDVGFKKQQILRAAAARDPLSRDGEWKVVRAGDRVFVDFQLAVTNYAGGTLPQPRLYPPLPTLPPPAGLTGGLVDLKGRGEDDEPPGGEDAEPNGTGPFIGVVSRSRRRSVLTYYGIERHDRWVFTPYFR